MFSKRRDDHHLWGSVFPFMQHLAKRNLLVETLQLSDAKYRSLFESMDQGIIYLDATGVVISVNQAAIPIIGLDKENILGQRLADICAKIIRQDGSDFPPEQHPALVALQSLMPVARVVMGLFNPEKNDYVWVTVTAVPEFMPGQLEPYQVLVALKDITRLKQAEEKLNLASLIVNHSGEGIFVTGSDHKIITVNRTFTSLTGFTQAEVFHKRISFLQAGQDESNFQAILQHNIGHNWQGEIMYRRKSGQAFSSWTTLNPVKDASGHINHYIYVFMDITPIKKTQENLGFLAYHDPLTKLPNRLLVKDRINHALQNAQRAGTQVAVLFLDLDHFKSINDSYGHAAGDSLLREVAKRIKNMVRKEDTVSRYSGDEFIVFMEDVSDTKNPATLARKLIDTFSIPIYIKGHWLQISTSVGISLYPKDGEDTDTLIKHADAAMYRAKKEGRNNFQYYSPELTLAVFEKMTLESALNHAVDRNQLILHYQPQVCLKTGGVVGVEALVRWKHPSMGLIAPNRFIPLAEENGFIVKLGEWILKRACMQMRQWLDEGIKVRKMVVNVSPIQFLRSDFVATVKRALCANKLDPRFLELEILESSLMEKSGRTINALTQLIASGVDVTIDGFGTGCFSLNNLKRIPVKKLKIDSSFVFDVLHNSDDEDITRSVIALGHSLHLQVIAEGIESEAQQQLLLDLGCDEGQGYLYSPPALPRSGFFRQMQS